MFFFGDVCWFGCFGLYLVYFWWGCDEYCYDFVMVWDVVCIVFGFGV